MGAKKKEDGAGYVVASPFRDKNDFNLAYNIGDDVSHLDEARLAELIGKGLVTEEA